jgi:hypothetical protein
MKRLLLALLLIVPTFGAAALPDLTTQIFPLPDCLPCPPPTPPPDDPPGGGGQLVPQDLHEMR